MSVSRCASNLFILDSDISGRFQPSRKIKIVISISFGLNPPQELCKMKISVQPINKVDFDRMAAFLIETRQSASDWFYGSDLERVVRSIEQNFGDTSAEVITAETATDLVGLVVVHYEQPKLAQLNPWFLGGLPLVSSLVEDSDLKADLVRLALETAEKNSITRVEVLYSRDCHNPEIISLFEGQGMQLIEELAHLRRPLDQLQSVNFELPESIQVSLLKDVQQEKLYQCWSKAFETGLDRSILSKTEEERRIQFNDDFDLSEPTDVHTSIALQDKESVIGFTLIKRTHGPNNGHIWEFGVHPEYRRKGLGKIMLSIIRDKLLEQGLESLSLNVDVANYPAYELYKSFGLQYDRGWVSYAWIRQSENL